MDVERIEGLEAEGCRIQSGILTHYAFNNPDALNEAQQDYRERAGLTIDREASVQLAMETLEGLKRVEAARAAKEQASGN